MRISKAGFLSAGLVLCGVGIALPASSQTGRPASGHDDSSGDRQDCTIVHRNSDSSSEGDTASNDTATSPSREDNRMPGTMSSTVTAGGGKVSGSTTMPHSNSTSSTSSSSVSAGNGRVTTTTTHNGKGITVTGHGTASSAGSANGDGSVSAGATADGNCTIVTD